MLGGMIKGSLVSISIKNGNQICVGQFGTAINPVALSAEISCNILPMHLSRMPRKHSLLLRRDLVSTKGTLATEHLV